VVNGCAVNPAQGDEIWVTVNTAQDLLRTLDAAAWTTKNSALGIDPAALEILWPDVNKMFTGGNSGSQAELLYSDELGADFEDESGSGIHGADNIVAIETWIEENVG
jgi:hypothetical protein